MNKIEEFLQRVTLQGLQVWPQEGNLRCAGPQQWITHDVLSQLKAYKAELLHQLCEPTYAPLSSGQRGLWFIQQQAPENTAYTVSLAFRIHSALNVELLCDTIQLLVNRHATLRTRFIWQEDALVQQIDGYQAAAIEMIDVGDCSEAALRQRIQAFHERPFDLSAGPLLRTAILTHAEQSYTLLLSVHHIVVDGWSVYQLVDELFTFYAALRDGLVADLPIIQHTYTDYVAWQQARLESDGAQLFAYWQTQLGGELPVLQLATDFPRPAQQALRGINQPFHLSPTLTEQLKQMARQNNCTLYMLLLAAYQVLLYRYTGQEDILVGLPMAGRSRPEFAEIVGYFVSPVVARADLRGNPTFAHLLAQVKAQVLAALDHQDYPFVRLVEQLNPQRDSSRSPIFQASFVLQKPHRAQTLISQSNLGEQFGLKLEPIPLTLFAGQDDIALEFMETSDGLLGDLKGNADLLAQTTLARMAGNFQVLLESIVVENPLGINQPIAHLPLLTEAERHQLLAGWNETQTDYPKDKCIHQLFEEQVERTPDAVAIVMAGEQKLAEDDSPVSSLQSLTYAELNARANQLAHHLQGLGVGPETLVGICVERSLEMVVGLLGILKVGGAYVPLDPSYPKERLAFMLQDSAAPLLLTQAHLQANLPPTRAEIVCLDEDWQQIAKQPSHNPASEAQAEQLAYIIYTSGSTGQPKGVMIEHGALTNFLWAMRMKPGFTAEDTLFAVTTLSFDIAGLELYLPLITGGKVVLTDSETTRDGVALASALVASEATVMQATPATWQLLLDSGWQGTPTIKLLCGGEALSPGLAERLSRCGSSLWNLYGPTETTIWSTLCPVLITDTMIPVGRPIANNQVYILDTNLQPTAIGVPGELFIGGIQVGRGYLNRPELTKEKFITNPFGAGRLYKTGDLARYLPDGNIEYLGRIDQQVKIRGFRIELGEIEAVLSQHPDVQEAVVIAREDIPGEKRLVAYVVQDKVTGWQDDKVSVNTDVTLSPPQPVTLSDLRGHLQQKLPDYMLPSAFVLLDALPLTPNGKTDRKALPAPDSSAISSKEHFVPPRTPIERAIADIWAAVLGVGQVGIHDNFFALGGHSLLAMRVLSRIHTSLQINLTLQQLFAHPTVAGLADFIENLQQIARPVLAADDEREEGAL